MHGLQQPSSPAKTGRMTRRLLCLPAAVLLTLLVASSALAATPEPRIVNGTEAAQGEYPAQGFLGINTDARSADRELLRRHARRLAAVPHRRPLHDERARHPTAAVELHRAPGHVDRTATPADEYAVTANDVNDRYISATFQNDSAMLTLGRVANYEPMRVVDDSEDALWAPDTVARIIGWGTHELRRQLLGRPPQGERPDHHGSALRRRVRIATTSTRA